MSTTKKNTIIPLYFNSSDRVNIDDSTTDYTIKLRKSIRNISSIDVSNVGIPKNYTNINKNNNILLVTFKSGNAVVRTTGIVEEKSMSITVPVQNYSGGELQLTVESLLNTNTDSLSLGLVWSIIYDNDTGYYEVSVVYPGGGLIYWSIEFIYTPLLDVLGIGSGKTTTAIYSTVGTETLIIDNTTNIKGDYNRKSQLYNNIHLNITSKVLTNNINTSYISSFGKSFNIDNNNDSIDIDTIQTLSDYVKQLDIGYDSVGFVLHGSSIAISGDGSVITAGAYRDEGFIGSIYTYKINTSGGSQYFQAPANGKTKAFNHTSANSQEGFSVSVDNSASVMVTGAWQDDWQLINDPLTDTPAKSQGAAYIYSWNGLTWSQNLKILPSNPFTSGAISTDRSRTHQLMGSYVNISGNGNRIAVAGSVETIVMVKKDNDVWVEEQTIPSLTCPLFNDDGTILFLTGSTGINIYRKPNNTWIVDKTIDDINFRSVMSTTETGTSFVLDGDLSGVSIYDDNGDGVYTKNTSTPISIYSGSTDIYRVTLDVNTNTNLQSVMSFGVSSSISADGNTLAIGDPSYTVSVRVATHLSLPEYVKSGTGISAKLTSVDNKNINDTGIDGIKDLQVSDKILVTSSGSQSDVDNGVYTIINLGVTGVSPWVLERDNSLNSDSRAVFGFNVSVSEGFNLNQSGYYIDTIDGNSQVSKGRAGISNPHDLITLDTTPFTFRRSGSNNGKIWIYKKNDADEWVFVTVITGSDTSKIKSNQGLSVKLSDDGSKVVFGGPESNYGVGGVWVWRINTSNTWVEVQSISPSGFLADTNQGQSTAICKRGTTFISGGPLDSGYAGAAWVYERSNFSWIQKSPKLVPSDGVGTFNDRLNNTLFGMSVDISYDGNTVVIGGPRDYGDGTTQDDSTGATWVFRREGDEWAQQGLKLVGSPSSSRNGQGNSVTINGNGNVIASIGDKITPDGTSGVFVFEYDGEVWVQHPSSPLKHSADNNNFIAVSMSEDGLTLVASLYNNSSIAVFNYVEDTGNAGVYIWEEYPTLLTNNTFYNSFGKALSISADGNTIAVGANGYVIIWIKELLSDVYTWSIQSILSEERFGDSVSLSSDGNIISVGALDSADRLDIASKTYVYKRDAEGVWSKYSEPIAGPSRTNAEDLQGYSTAVEYLGDSDTDFVLIIGGIGFGAYTQNFIGGNWSFISRGIYEITETFEIENRAYTIFDLINTLNLTMISTNMSFVSEFNNNETITISVVSNTDSFVLFKLNSSTTFDIADFLPTQYSNSITSIALDFSINNNIIKSVDTSSTINSIVYDTVTDRSFRKYEAGYTIEENELIDVQLRDERDRIIDLNGSNWIMTVYATIHN